MSVIAFVQDRVRRGYMQPVATARINRLVRTMDRATHQHLCAVQGAVAAVPYGTRLRVREVELRDANAFVNMHHRHLGGVVGHKFSMACIGHGRLVGVAIVGRPVAEALDDGSALEITRVATDGSPNACSKLLAAARAEAGRRGYKVVYTYTMPGESGVSLRAAGYRCDGPAGGGSWSRAGRQRSDRHPTDRKLRWSSACVALPRTPLLPLIGDAPSNEPPLLRARPNPAPPLQDTASPISGGSALKDVLLAPQLLPLNHSVLT